MKYMCPVCDYDNLELPPRNHEICPCCGTEVGFDDFEKSNQQLRFKWIRGGRLWWSKNVTDDREIKPDLPLCPSCDLPMSQFAVEEDITLYLCYCEGTIGVINCKVVHNPTKG